MTATIKLPPPVKCANPRCGHTWTPTVAAPKVCPACKSYHWNDPAYFAERERQRKLAENERATVAK